MRTLAVSLGLLALAIGVQADAWEAVIAKAQSAVVYIQVGDDGGCSGFVINKAQHYVMTAAHCNGDRLWVDRVRGEVVALDVKKDLMVLQVKDLDPAREALTLAAHDPSIREDVMSVGYGYALERPFFKTAHVSDTAVQIPQEGLGGPFIGVDASFTPGQSGGPVLNVKGEVVAIVQRGDGGTLGLGVGADVMRERLGRFFAR